MRSVSAIKQDGKGWYAVALCMIAFVFSYGDRQILSLLIEPIQADLGISDTQFGLLHGLAFALFYAVMGLPISTLSDRVSRPLVIASGVLVWSMATMACGFARGFLPLLVGRMFVGAGEAVLSPATYSLISDLFSREKLGRATAIYSMGSFLGVGLAYVVAAAVISMLGTDPVSLLGGIEFRPWQMALVVVGAPGILLACLIAGTVRDPLRGRARTTPGFGAVLEFLWRQRSIFLPHMLGYSLYAMALFGLLAWSPAYLIRVHGVSSQHAGYWLGAMAILCSGAGVLTSGWQMDRLMVRGIADGPFRLGVIGAIGMILPLAILPFCSDVGVAMAVLALAMYFSAFPMPPSAAVMQIAVPGQMRSRVSAIFLFCNSIIGLTMGAGLIGLLNDHYFRRADAVGSSISVVAGLAALLAALILSMGLRPFRTLVSHDKEPS